MLVQVKRTVKIKLTLVESVFYSTYFMILL